MGCAAIVRCSEGLLRMTNHAELVVVIGWDEEGRSPMALHREVSAQEPQLDAQPLARLASSLEA